MSERFHALCALLRAIPGRSAEALLSVTQLERDHVIFGPAHAARALQQLETEFAEITEAQPWIEELKLFLSE